MKRFCFDLDGTLVKTNGNDYENSTPIPKAIAKVNKLFDAGNWIIIDTARGGTSGINWREFTAKQLEEFGIQYHELFVGEKHSADYFIDDKGVNAQDWLDCEKEALAKVGEVY